MANNWTWQRNLLERHGRGLISDEQFFETVDARNNRIGRHPTPRVCRKCGSPALYALDHDRCARLAAMDPHALTPDGEVWALHNKRSTFEFTPTGIRSRDQFTIPGRPPTTSLVVVAAHVCGEPVPEQYWLRIPKKPAPTPVQHDGDFPF